MRLLGIDFGFKRIGVAVGVAEHAIVNPRPTIEATGALKTDATKIAAIAKNEQADKIVIGLPVELSGEEGRMARICRTLGEELQQLGQNVFYVDETLSSVQAEATLREEGLKASHRRKRRDGEAACLILERYLHEQASN